MAKRKKAQAVYAATNVMLRDTCELLDEMAEADAETGDRPDRSATLRALIRAEHARRVGKAATS